MATVKKQKPMQGFWHTEALEKTFRIPKIMGPFIHPAFRTGPQEEKSIQDIYVLACWGRKRKRVVDGKPQRTESQ